MELIHVIVLAIIEGLTEFLPVSSTGHMVVASSLMGINKLEFVKLFEVVIQLGAILAVVALYFKRFFKSINFYIKLVIGVLPAVVFGVLFKEKINAMLENPLIVAGSFVVGGIVLVFVDNWFKQPTVTEEEKIDNLTALKIGFFQCLAMVPGVSRSAASIIGGMTQKLSRKAAAEFSFFLAVPTMAGATLKDLYDFYKHGNIPAADLQQDIQYLLIGSVIAFIVALLAIKSFITFLEQKGFRLFGYYRIIAGIVIIILYYSGNVLHT